MNTFTENQANRLRKVGKEYGTTSREKGTGVGANEKRKNERQRKMFRKLTTYGTSLALLLCCVCLVPRRVVADSRVTRAIWDPASLPASFESTLNVLMVHCAILLIAPSRVFRFQTLETPRNGLASSYDGN